MELNIHITCMQEMKPYTNTSHQHGIVRTICLILCRSLEPSSGTYISKNNIIMKIVVKFILSVVCL